MDPGIYIQSFGWHFLSAAAPGSRTRMERFICIHAHFYQPPRENPWLEAVEGQESAYPYHDWNERITAECYAPNAASRILDGSGHISQIVNNYSRISFNFGPTLLSWMEEKAPETYQQILDSDRESQKRFAGHGSALAQAYNHMILPLATDRDKYTQVVWGIRDFEARFGRAPEGMWLPEAAVDIGTLEVLAQLGIKFTVLAPRQAARVRKIGGRSWKDVSGGRIDPTRAYLARLPSGKRISLFFYDGPISQGVAFEKLLDNGESFADRLKSGFSDKRTWPQLMNIATDGETYGHHHRYGEMALAAALDKIESEFNVRLSNYGEFLSKFPPEVEVQIAPNSSWSCYHGVERWRGNCGCNSGRAGWNQEWRAPLREALDYLRDRAAELFESKAAELVHDPWAARNDYIDVVLDRSAENLWFFFEKHSRRELRPEETSCALQLMEMQRHAMLMYTSCGWFFDEISGIETVQVLQYAGRVIQLAQQTTGEDLEPQFLEILSRAKSNIPEYGDGARVYEMFARPAFVDLPKVGAHFAISAMFDGHHETPMFCYDITRHDYRRLESGLARFGLGRARITSKITRECRELTFAGIHMGDQVLHAGVRDSGSDEDYVALAADAMAAFSTGDLPEVLRILDAYFGEMQYSLRSLFKDEQKRIIDIILTETLQDAEAGYHRIYQKHGPLLRFLKEMDQPIPDVLRITAQFVLNSDLVRTFQSDPVDSVRLSMLLELVKREGVQIEEAGVGFAAGNAVTRLLKKLAKDPQNGELLQHANLLVSIVQMLPFKVSYWDAQNIYYSLLQTDYPVMARRSDAASRHWVENFAALGEKLQVSVPPVSARAELRMAS
jgi:alpha-amylase/alpha-mannosidase (GH57 family)